MYMPRLTLTRRGFMRVAGSATVLLLTPTLAACGQTSPPVEAHGATRDLTKVRPFWDKSGGDDLLHGKSFQALFDGLPTRMQSFILKDTAVRCIDEGCPGGIHMAGSGCLNPNAEADLRGKVSGVYSHEGCGVVKLFMEKTKNSAKDADAVADQEAKKLADKLGVPYMGRIGSAQMTRPADLHTARAIYYDGTGKFDPSAVPGLPQGFVHNRKIISDVEYAKTEVEVAIEIAFGSHGFGEMFTPISPLYIVAVSGLNPESIPAQNLATELNDVAGSFDNIEIQTLYATPTAARAPGAAPAIVKASARETSKAGAETKLAPFPDLPGANRKPTFGPVYTIRDRTVNLADPGGRRFLRFSMAIEFAPKAEEGATAKPHAAPLNGTDRMVAYDSTMDSRDGLVAEAAKDPQKTFESAIKRYVPAMEDVVVSSLGMRTYADMLSPVGKEQSKVEILARLQKILAGQQTVTNLYYLQFVMQ